MTFYIPKLIIQIPKPKFQNQKTINAQSSFLNFNGLDKLVVTYLKLAHAKACGPLFPFRKIGYFSYPLPPIHPPYLLSPYFSISPHWMKVEKCENAAAAARAAAAATAAAPAAEAADWPLAIVP